jgi:thioredoxin-like negative regulator of GroEL
MLKKMNKKLVIIMIIMIIIIIGFFVVLPMLTKENYGLSKTKKEIMFFSMKGCGHCVEFQPVWDALVNNYGNTEHLELIQIKYPQQEKIVEEYGIKAFPTIVAVNKGKIIDTYNDERSYEPLQRWMTHFISDINID